MVIHEAKNIPKKAYYVSMTDKFMSGWGMAEGKINKYVIGCDTYEQASTIKRNAQNRREMKYINISSRKPTARRGVIYSYEDFSELGEIWTK